MNRAYLVIAALPILLLGACSDSEASGTPPEILWPASGSTIFVDTPISLAGAEAGSRVAVISDGAAVANGTAVANDAPMLIVGTAASLDLDPGETRLIFQLVDADGQSLGAGLSAEASYTVVASPPERRVFFAEPEDGAQVTSPFKVRFGLVGMGLTPASVAATIPDKTQGHHHIIIETGPLGPGIAVPDNATNIHYGKAQTETELELKPGKYRLTMQFADGLHMSYGPSMSATINIEVIE